MKRRPLATGCLILIFLLYTGTGFMQRLPSDFLPLEGRSVVVTGMITQKEQVNKDGLQQTILYLQLDSLTEGKKQIQIKENKQKAICYLKPNQKIPEIGSYVKAIGRLKCFSKASNPGQFDAESYYRILKISFQLNQTEIKQKSITYSEVKESLYLFQKKCGAVFDKMLPPKEASLMKTMLLGEKRAIDAEIKTLYQQNGIAHILAISGLHISLLGMGLYRLLKQLGGSVWVRTSLPMGIIVLYVLMTGFSVSAVRAMMMFLLQMSAQLCRRTYDLFTAASLAALLLLAEQPLYLYHSGFLLSFGCVYAIGVIVPVMTTVNSGPKKEKQRKKHRKRQKQPEGIQKCFLSGLALTLAVLPLQIWFFYQIPLYATLLNLLVIPLLSFLVLAGILLLLVENVMIIPIDFISEITALLITGILTVYEKSCLLLMQLPGHLLIMGRPKVWQVVIYLLILISLVLMRKRLSLKKKWLLLAGGVLLLVSSFSGNISVTFLDVGQGDCIHIRSAKGRHYLVDGGSLEISSVGKYRIIPYLQYQGAGEVEAVFITHPDEDHCNGILELLETGKRQGIIIKKVYLPDIGAESKADAYWEIVEAAEKAGAKVQYLSKGQSLRDGRLLFFCLHPEKAYENRDANAWSMVLSVSYGNFETLLTGDVEGEGESLLIKELQRKAEREKKNRLTVLKVAHHGSAYSTPEELLALLEPVYAIISCGENNSYGHPHQELLFRLQEQKAEICITAKTGAVTFETDGKRLWMSEFLAENN